MTMLGLGSSGLGSLELGSSGLGSLGLGSTSGQLTNNRVGSNTFKMYLITIKKFIAQNLFKYKYYYVQGKCI